MSSSRFLQKGLLSLAIFGALLVFSLSSYAQESTPTPTPTSSPSSAQSTSNVGDCASNNITVADCPNYLQKKISDLQSQDKTLSSQIAIADSQINLTEAKIAKTADLISPQAQHADDYRFMHFDNWGHWIVREYICPTHFGEIFSQKTDHLLARRNEAVGDGEALQQR